MARLTSALREIVHPQATPTMPMMMIATQQGGPPRNIPQMMQYTPHMVEMANRLNVKPPGVNGTITPNQLQEFIVQRGMNWLQRQATVAGLTGGEMGLGTDATTLGGLGMAAGAVGPMAALSRTPVTSATSRLPLARTSTGMSSLGGMGGFGGLGGFSGMGGLGMMAMADMDFPMLGMGGLGMGGLGMGGLGMGGLGMGGLGRMGMGGLMNMHLLGMEMPMF